MSQATVNIWTNGNPYILENSTFHQVVDNLKDVVFQIDQEGCWTYLNPAWVAITGVSTEDALGSHFQGYVLPEDRKIITSLFNQIKNHVQTEAQTVVRFISKTRKIIWIDFLMKRLTDQDDFIIGSLRDITLSMENERRLRTINKMLVEGLQREQALTEEYQLMNEKLIKNEEDLNRKILEVSELYQKLKENMEKIEEYAILFALSRDLIAIADFNGHFMLVNPAWEHTLGFTIEELLDKPFLDFVHPDDKKNTQEAAQKLAEGEVEFVEFVNRYQTKNGEYRWLSWNAKSSANHKKIYNIARDITDHRQTEE